jgi:hypothetical protein
MSNVNPLRAEFVLTGLAFLASLTGFLIVVEPNLFNGVHLNDVEKLALPLTVGGIAAAYVVGIVVAQLTYFIPTEYMIKRIRCSRLDDLRKIQETYTQEESDKTIQPTDPQTILLKKAFSEKGLYKVKSLPRFSEPNDQDAVIHIQTLALTIGRAYAPTQLTDEYKYRRANRQVFIGMLPSAVVGVFTGVFAVAPSVPLIVAVIVGFLIVFWIIWASAKYQEEVAQSIILDVAFLRRWGIDTRMRDDESNRAVDAVLDADGTMVAPK